MITMNKTDDGFSVRFPFELKDAFRKLFPSATWDSYDKTWNVGLRSGSRLEQWIAEVNASGVVEELAARDEKELVEREIATLRTQLAAVRREIAVNESAVKALNEKRELSVELRAKLEQQRAKLDEAKAEKAAAETAAADEFKRVEQLVSHIATKAGIERLQRSMKFSMLKLKRSEFDESRDEMLTIYRELKKIGVHCEAVSAALDVNYNRRDRDLEKFEEEVLFESAEE